MTTAYIKIMRASKHVADSTLSHWQAIKAEQPLPPPPAPENLTLLEDVVNGDIPVAPDIAVRLNVVLDGWDAVVAAIEEIEKC